MLRKILLLAALVAAVSAQAQIDTILIEPLIGKFKSSSEMLAESPSSLPGWTFENCYALATNGKTYVQVGSRTNSGAITTPTLTGLTGNARINFAVQGIDEGVKVRIRRNGVGSLSYSITSEMPDKTNWYSQPSSVLRNANASSKILFYNANGGERFEIRNILICDIGENIFYESFDKNNTTGGNDGGFTNDDIDRGETAAFDNPGYSKSDVKSANQCVFLDGSKASYTTSTIPNTSSGNLILSFRVAGMDDRGDHHLDVTCTGVTPSPDRIVVRNGVWDDVTIELLAVEDNPKITFTGNYVFLDEIRIREKASETLTMNQADASNPTLSAMTLGTVANVTLTRTLTAGIWNTLCLPFRFDNTMLAGENHILRLTSVTDGCFNFTEDDAVPAGEPFLLQVSSTTADPTFNNVTIRTKSPGTKMFGEYGLLGIFYATDLETGESNAFLGTDGNLYYPADKTKTMNGLRAYFVKPASAPVRVSFSFFEPAAIREVHREAVAREYNLWGQRVTSSRRGIIVRNGKKVYRQ